MERDTDQAANAKEQPDSDNEFFGSVRVSVEVVGQLVVSRDGIGPTLYLPNLENLAMATESIRPTLKAFTDVAQQISRIGLKTLGKRLAQWRKGLNALISKRSKLSYLSLSRFEKFLLLDIKKVIGQILRLASLPQVIGTFVQQVVNSKCLMLTGPPSLSTGLPVFNSVTTWGRVI